MALAAQGGSRYFQAAVAGFALAHDGQSVAALVEALTVAVAVHEPASGMRTHRTLLNQSDAGDLPRVTRRTIDPATMIHGWEARSRAVATAR